MRTIDWMILSMLTFISGQNIRLHEKKANPAEVIGFVGFFGWCTYAVYSGNLG